MQIEPLGLERDKQIGEARGEKPQCSSLTGGYCVGENNYIACRECPKSYDLPYSSDLSVCMRLVDVSWQITVVHDYAQWRCIIKQGNTLLENGYGATPALAMIDAITRAWLEVQD